MLQLYHAPAAKPLMRQPIASVTVTVAAHAITKIITPITENPVLTKTAIYATIKLSGSVAQLVRASAS